LIGQSEYLYISFSTDINSIKEILLVNTEKSMVDQHLDKLSGKAAIQDKDTLSKYSS